MWGALATRVVGVKGVYAQWASGQAPPHPAVWLKANDFTFLSLSFYVC